ncbi:hypothetical protein B0T22DRAFT_242060 [Podospora appendiculata]|uniref:Uncharacterized protein n=1 Tax=Podospora appendiculata TaxID=314037 RepID=A0AAE0X6M8_9PEZI|nr:hypothetical protein B0T22DRAFT_242060 [Podospora appendiculata]
MSDRRRNIKIKLNHARSSLSVYLTSPPPPSFQTRREGNRAGGGGEDVMARGSRQGGLACTIHTYVTWLSTSIHSYLTYLTLPADIWCIEGTYLTYTRTKVRFLVTAPPAQLPYPTLPYPPVLFLFLFLRDNVGLGLGLGYYLTGLGLWVRASFRRGRGGGGHCFWDGIR